MFVTHTLATLIILSFDVSRAVRGANGAVAGVGYPRSFCATPMKNVVARPQDKSCIRGKQMHHGAQTIAAKRTRDAKQSQSSACNGWRRCLRARTRSATTNMSRASMTAVTATTVAGDCVAINILVSRMDDPTKFCSRSTSPADRAGDLVSHIFDSPVQLLLS